MKVGTLLVRATVGGVFIGHGAQKLFGVAGGHGLKGTGQYFESLGLRPGIVHATAAGVAETGGGLGLVLGYRTPLAGAGIIATMATAIQRVHGKNGWNIQAGGFEYNALLIASTLAVVEAGPGVLSLDALRGKQHTGLPWMLFSLGAGLAGAAGSHVLAGGSGGGAPSTAEVASTVADAVQSSGDKVAEAAGQAGESIKSVGTDLNGAATPAGSGSGTGSGHETGGGAAGGADSVSAAGVTGAPFVEAVAEEKAADTPPKV